METINLTGKPLPPPRQWPDRNLKAMLTKATPHTTTWECSELVIKWAEMRQRPRSAERHPQPKWWDDAKIGRIAGGHDPAAIFALTIDYPVKRPAVFDMCLNCDVDIREILWRASRCYTKVYAAAGKPEIPTSGLVNPSFPEDTGWGVWGHSIDDLWFERVHVDHRARTIRLFVGS